MILVEYPYESLYYPQQLYYPAIQGEPATQAKAFHRTAVCDFMLVTAALVFD
ncbi:MAG: hypothetical protein WBP83_13295 [Nitrososphaeraceae archaeon]